MKKQIIGHVLAAFVFLAASSFFANLHGQEVKFTFINPDGGDYGNPDGIGGRDLPIEPRITLEFKVGVAGQVALDASTISTNADNIRVVDAWDSDNVGNTPLQSAWGKSFTLILTSSKRLQLGTGGDGIGCQGTNQRRIDGAGSNEEVYLILEGGFGLEFTEVGYRDINYQDGDANMEIWDHDTKQVWMMENVGADPGYWDVTGVYNMRYKSDSLTFTHDDEAINNANAGGRLLSLAFNVVEALPKPPDVITTTPPNADSLTQNIADDYVIEFDAAMDQAATSAAVKFIPDVPNRADTWSDGDEGDVLTVSFDDLEYETWYSVVIGTDVKGDNGLFKVVQDTLTFKTLPEPPSVIATFPENLATEVPIDSPISFEFSKSMIPDSVEKAISFNPELMNLTFVWNEDNSAVYVSTSEMAPSNMYFGTVSTVAMDIFGVQMPEPFLFAFTTSIATSIEKNKASGLVIYPNPASDLLQISGVDVASVKIYGLTGQLLREVYDSQTVNVSDINTGVYVVSVSDKGNKVYKQLITIK